LRHAAISASASPPSAAALADGASAAALAAGAGAGAAAAGAAAGAGAGSSRALVSGIGTLTPAATRAASSCATRARRSSTLGPAADI